MIDFEYFIGTKVDFGEGKLKKIPQKLKEFGIHTPCLVADSVLFKQDFVQELIREIPNLTVYTNVVANPTIDSVNECAQWFLQHDCDGMIALGGGSTMDTVKGASVVATTGKSVEYFLDGCTQNRELVPQKLVPFIAVPTTSGTGSEVSQYAVITNETTHRKDSISSFHIYPVYAVVDPAVTYGLPAPVTIATGLDVLSHAIEGITSTIENPIADLLALEAIRKVFCFLPDAVHTGDHQARAEMALASLMAGMAMSHCCGTLPHGMGCPLSGHCDVPHGLAVGVLQIPTIELLQDVCDEQFRRIAAYLDSGWESRYSKTAAQYLIMRITELFKQINRSPDLKEFHITEEQIDAMTVDAKVHGCTGLMPIAVDEETMKQIYQRLA
jgi:alcohol dehydrogenase class IV